MTNTTIIKKIVYSIILITLSFSVVGQDNSVFGINDINKNHVLYKNNRIKSIKEFRYKNEKAKGKGKLITYNLYDTTGMLTEEFSYYSKEYHRNYEYNEKGYLSKDIGYVLNSAVETNYIYKYDDLGRIIEKEVGKFPISNDIYYYNYDSIGNMNKIKWLMGRKKDSFYFIDAFEYNTNNTLAKMIRYQPDQSVYFYKTYAYDTSGNLAREIRFERNDTTDVWEYRYDSNHNCTEWEYFDKLSKRHSFSKTNYNNKGLVISRPGYKGYLKCIYEYYN